MKVPDIPWQSCESHKSLINRVYKAPSDSHWGYKGNVMCFIWWQQEIQSRLKLRPVDQTRLELNLIMFLSVHPEGNRNQNFHDNPPISWSLFSAKQLTTEKSQSVKHHCSGKAGVSFRELEFKMMVILCSYTSSVWGDLWTPESCQHFSTLNMTSPCRCWTAPCWWWPRHWRDQNCSSTARMQSSWTPHGPHPLSEMGCCDKHTHTDVFTSLLLQLQPSECNRWCLTSSPRVQGQVGVGLPAPWAWEGASNLLQHQQENVKFFSSSVLLEITAFQMSILI